MLDILSGDEASFVFPCEVNGEAVQPTTGTAKFTVYTVLGVAIPALTNIAAAMLPGGTEALVVIEGSNNILVDSEPLTRFVRFQFESGGRVLRQQESYRILPFLPITVTPEYIRMVLLGGVGPSDKSAYDIYGAYLEAKRAIPTLDDHLVGEYASEANQAIGIYAARPHAKRLMISLNQREKSHDEEVERFRGIDFAAISAGLDAELVSLLMLLNGTGSLTPYPAVELTTPTDVVTGQ